MKNSMHQNHYLTILYFLSVPVCEYEAKAAANEAITNFIQNSDFLNVNQFLDILYPQKRLIVFVDPSPEH